MVGEVDGAFCAPLASLQPSQLYISSAKLARVRQGLDSVTAAPAGPLPVTRMERRWVLTDGHTRAVAAHLAGAKKVRVYRDRDELDTRAYAICVRWCQEAEVRSPADLASRIVDEETYHEQWLDR